MTLFEIYRLDGRYEAVLYTDLGEAERDEAIARALEGEPWLDGYLRTEEGRAVLAEVVAALNRGEPLGPEEAKARLLPL